MEGVDWIRVAEWREPWVTCEDGNAQFYTIVRMMYQIWSYLFHGRFYSEKCIDVLLTVHLSIILAIDQLNAQILVL